MEVALFTPFALSIMQWITWSPGVVAIWFWLIMLLSFNLVRLMSLIYLPGNSQRNVIAISLLIMLFISLPTLLYEQSLFDLSWISEFFSHVADQGNQLWTKDLSVILLTVFLWWRGIRLAGQSFNINRIGLRLRLGGLILAPIIIWSSTLLEWDITPFVLLFFLAVLTAIALVRAEQLEQERSGHSASLNPRWLTIIFMASLMTVLSAALLASLISGNSPLILAYWLKPVWSRLYLGVITAVWTMGYVLRPLTVVLSFFIEKLSFLLSLLFSSTFLENLTLPTVEAPLPEATTDLIEAVEPSLIGGKAIAILLLLGLVLIVALTLRQAFRYLSPATRNDALAGINEDRSTVTKSMGQRLLRKLGNFRNWRAAASIRRIYREMGLAAETSGYPRALSETPYEYQDSLSKVWPQNTADSRLITQAYINVRYGEFPETRDELNEINAAWQRLKHTKPCPLDTGEMAENLTVFPDN